MLFIFSVYSSLCLNIPFVYPYDSLINSPSQRKYSSTPLQYNTTFNEDYTNRYHSPENCEMSENIGIYSAITIVPTTTPRNTIISGSRRDVRLSTVADTSES